MKEWIDEATGIPMCEADCADEWLQLIWAVGCDYDGCNDADSLKHLIDELVRMSQDARACLRDGKLFPKDTNGDSGTAKCSIMSG